MGDNSGKPQRRTIHGNAIIADLRIRKMHALTEKGKKLFPEDAK